MNGRCAEGVAGGVERAVRGGCGYRNEWQVRGRCGGGLSGRCGGGLSGRCVEVSRCLEVRSH